LQDLLLHLSCRIPGHLDLERLLLIRIDLHPCAKSSKLQTPPSTKQRSCSRCDQSERLELCKVQELGLIHRLADLLHESHATRQLADQLGEILSCGIPRFFHLSLDSVDRERISLALGACVQVEVRETIRDGKDVGTRQ
jgi:hypothetical protein